MTLETNPLAVLTFIAAPAILTNASSLLALGTSNRFARNVERARQLITSLGKAEKSDPVAGLLMTQLVRTERRAVLLIRALASFYFSLGCFAAGSLASLLGAILTAASFPTLLRVILSIALVAGVLGLVGMITGCTVLVHETRLALMALREDVGFFRRHHEAAEARGNQLR